MRYLKFKVWDKKQKKMFDVYSLGKDFVSVVTDDGIDPGVNCFDGDYFKNNIVVLQYTGLKDKNRTEIYEGDLLRFPAKDKWDETNYSAFEVFFHDGNESYGTGIGYRMCRMYNQGVIGGGVVHTFHPKNTERMEVIGNIYQNPELL